MMKTISVCSLSGGQGKTTTTLLLAKNLTAAGYTVCMLDADPQHSLTLFSGIELENTDRSLLEFIKGQGEGLDCVYPVEGDENLFIVPSDDTLDAAQDYLIQTGMGATVLKRRLGGLEEHFDFCLIDSPPQRSQLVLTVLGAADQLLIPAESTIKGFASAVRSLDLYHQQLDLGATEANLLGVIPFRDRWFGRNQSKESSLSINAMKEEVGEDKILPSILESEKYKRSIAHGTRLPEKLNYPFKIILERLQS
jgi:chromosome partitioning protein